MITSRSKCRPRNNSSMLFRSLTVGPQLSKTTVTDGSCPFAPEPLLAQQQGLRKQPGKRIQMPLAKLRYGVVIGMLVRRQIAKRHIFIRPGLDPARTVDPRRVAVQQDVLVEVGPPVGFCAVSA